MKHNYAKGKIPSSISLPPELREKLIEATGGEWGRLSGVVAEACREWLQNHGHRKPETAKPIPQHETIHTPPQIVSAPHIVMCTEVL